MQDFSWAKIDNDTAAWHPEQVAYWLKSGSDRIVIRVFNYDGESLTATFPIGGYADAESAMIGECQYVPPAIYPP